jgi:MFS transporter, PPP family, 3-phenylpropionic acid transporter
MMPTAILKPFQAVSSVTFLNYAARGMTLPFINLYLVVVGFTATEIGIVLGISAFVRLVVPPMLNALADNTGRHRQLFIGLVLGTALTTLALVFPISKLWLAGVVIARDSLDLPSASLLSQLTIAKLKVAGRDIYGRIRAWGSLGWGVTAMISGSILNLGGYALLFVIAALINIVSLAISRILPARTTEGTYQPDDDLQDGPTRKRKPAFYILMTSWFLFYVGMSTTAGFMFIYFQQELGVSNAMIGVLAAVAALAEIPSMMLIDLLLRRVNIRATLITGILGMAALWVAMSLLAGPALLILLMMVRGTFFTFQNVSMTLLVSRVSHPTNAATNQAIAYVTVPALAVLMTGPIAGWIFDNIGPRELFQVVAMVAVLGALLLLAARRKLAAVPVVAGAAAA